MNSVTLTGSIAGPITTREFGSGEAAKTKARFLLAVRRQGKDRKPDLIPVETWGSQAINVAKFCGPKSRVSVSGRLRSEFYNPSGAERGGKLQTVVVADRIEFLTPPPVDAEAAAPEPGGGSAPARGGGK